MTMPIEAGADLPEASTGNVGNVSQTESSLLFRKINLFDEDKFHQDITQFEYNWTLQKDSFPIVSEEDPIQIADSLILKIRYVLYQSTIMKADIRQTGASKDTFLNVALFFTEKKEIECTTFVLSII